MKKNNTKSYKLKAKSYFIKTFGCQMNVSDSERIAGFLEKPHPSPLLIKERGLRATKDINKADIIIFNTCGIRQMAEDRVYGQIHNLHKLKAKSHPPAGEAGKLKAIILTGCLANRKDVQKKLKDKVDLFCEIKDFQKEIIKLLSRHPERSEGSTKEHNWQYKEIDSSTPFSQRLHSAQNDDCYLNILPKYSNSKSAYVPVMTGCNNFCAYCVVPYARGREISRPIQEIFSEIENLSKNNCKEITLLGQNVNSYFYKKTPGVASLRHRVSKASVTFPTLLDSLAKKFHRINFKFLTSHPKDFSEDLMKVIAKNKNISREIHLPIQAGSDKILKAMNRPYTQKHYLDLIKKARKIISGASFTTDVIVGFPSETEKDFQESVKVFKKVNYNEAYINKYSPRPGTTAFKLGDPISWDEKKRREKVLRELIK